MIEISTLADTIEWLAEERLKAGWVYQNRASAVHSIMLDVMIVLTRRYSKKAVDIPSTGQ